jgi:hypothetical protein
MAVHSEKRQIACASVGANNSLATMVCYYQHFPRIDDDKLVKYNLL